LTDLKPKVGYLERVGIVYADELRLKIVTELYLREMSPAQFRAEFGGGSISRVDHHFKRLVEYGWLRYVRSETGEGRRPGGTQRFYRATGLPIFDKETWGLVPYSMRVEISWTTFKQFAERVVEALRAKTLDARSDSHLSWTPVLLDEAGWDVIASAVDFFFESLREEIADARLRIHRSGEKPMRATVGLALFESPPPDLSAFERRTPILAEGVESPIPTSRRVYRVFNDPISLLIVARANLCEISAPEFQRELDHGKDIKDTPRRVKNIRSRFKALEELGWLRKSRVETGGRRRSAKEQFYRATGPAIYDNESWADVPDDMKPIHSWTTFVQLSEQVKKAIDAGTFEARLDNHLSWSLLELDQLGWEKIASEVDALMALVLKEKDRSEDRLAASGEQPALATVALAAFESPKSATKVP
jgi:hypothetical protein